eukprot:s1549_g13.t1
MCCTLNTWRNDQLCERRMEVRPLQYAIHGCHCLNYTHQTTKSCSMQPKSWQDALASGDVVLCNKAITSMGRNSHWQAVIGLLEKMMVARLQPSVVTFAACISACARATQFQPALQTFQSAQEAVSLNLVIFNIAINACEKVSQWQQALAWLHEAASEHLQLDVVTFTSVASCLPNRMAHNTGVRAGSQSNDWRQSIAQLELLGDSKLEPDIVTYNVIQLGCYAGGGWETSLRVLSELKRSALIPDICSHNTAITGLEHHQQWLAALNQLNVADACNMPDVQTYSAAMVSCATGEQWQAAVMLLEKSAERSLQCNTVLINSCLTACERATAWEAAVFLLDEVGQKQSELDVISLNVAISACAAASEWQVALDLLTSSSSRQLQRNSISFNSAMKVSEKNQRWQFALVLLRLADDSACVGEATYSAVVPTLGTDWKLAMLLIKQMENRWLEANQMTSTAMIVACGQGSEWKNALQLFAEMSAMVKPDVIMLNAAIGACERATEWQEALGLLDGSQQVFPDIVTYNTLMSALGKASLWQLVLQLMQQIWWQRLEPDMFSYNTAISACEKSSHWQRAMNLLSQVLARQGGWTGSGLQEKASEWQQALAILKFLLRSSLQINVITCNALISACEKATQWRRALALLQQMDFLSIRPNVCTFNAALSACENASAWQKAQELLVLMRKLNEQPDVITWNASISTYGKAAMWQLSIQALARMDAQGLLATEVTYSAALDACARVPQWREALHFVSPKCEGTEIESSTLDLGRLLSACVRELSRKQHRLASSAEECHRELKTFEAQKLSRPEVEALVAGALADWVRAAQAGADAVTGAMQKSRSGAGFGTETSLGASLTDSYFLSYDLGREVQVKLNPRLAVTSIQRETLRLQQIYSCFGKE